MGKAQICPSCQASFFAGKSVATPRQAAPAAAAAGGYAQTMVAEQAPPITYNCPRCKAPLEAPASEAGTKKNCPNCSQRLQVPNPPPPKSEPAAVAPNLNKTMLASDESAAPPIKYNCPSCKKPLEAPASQAGTKRNCPECNQRLQIPAAPAKAPMQNRTMLASAEGNGLQAAPRAGEHAPSMAPTAGGAPTAPAGAQTLLTPRNVIVGAVLLVLLALIVPAVIRGGTRTDDAALAQQKLELEKLKAEIDLKKAEMDRQKQAEDKFSAQIAALMQKSKEDEAQRREEQRRLLQKIEDDQERAKLVATYKKQQEEADQRNRDRELALQKQLEDAKRAMDDNKRALEAAQQKQTVIQQQPAPVVVYQPYHPRYYWPYW
jgi:DNA-directed RNA polymerase subunit RPC12/RpoP